MKYISTCLISLLCSGLLLAQYPDDVDAPEHRQLLIPSGPQPDRIILSWEEDPATTITITWRTDPSVTNALVEILPADSLLLQPQCKKVFPADLTVMSSHTDVFHYHKALVNGLTANTLYAYRVGNGQYWSEWVQFSTANDQPEAFSFLYLGDAQSNIYSTWSRTIRAAFKKEPNARFILYSGDLVDHADNDYEWGEWFQAGSFINRMIPVFAVPGNHEYAQNQYEEVVDLSMFWKPQFNFPKNGITGMEDQVYFLDYQNIRLIALNSNENIDEQAKWLEEVLKSNTQLWTIVVFHHPVYSTSEGRSNESISKLWQPLLEQYNVDLVLQGHDHSYARGSDIINGNYTGPVYVTSVSGDKMYEANRSAWADRTGKNMQCYQLISVVKNRLRFASWTVTGKLYDHFELIKNKNSLNSIEEIYSEPDE